MPLGADLRVFQTIGSFATRDWRRRYETLYRAVVRVASLFVVGFVLSASGAFADDGFSSDRPGYANGTSSAPVLRPITETGVTLRWDEDDPTQLTAPDLRIRTGVADWLELRLDVPTLVVTFGDEEIAAGDLTLAAKLGGTFRNGLALSLIPSVTIPMGSTTGKTTSRLEVNWAVSAGIVGFGGNVAAGIVQVDDERLVQGEGSLAISVQAAPKFGLYAQGFATWVRGADPLPYAGVGFYVQALSYVQVDLYADVGLTDDATRLTVGAGVSVLWPGREDD